jgi:LL-diaminopimelate aminotransferase
MLVKKVLIDRADRLYQMPPDILDFARPLLGKPILPCQPILDLASFEWPSFEDSDEKIKAESLLPASGARLVAFREMLAEWLTQHFGGSRITPKQVFVGGGIRSLLLHTALAYVEPGDPVLVPGLGLPVYRKVVTACGGLPLSYQVSSRSNWTPDFSRISTRVGQAVRMCIINSPHNPTGAELGEKELTALIERCGKENILLVNDACYYGIPQRRPLSLTAAESGHKVGLELFSFAYLLGLPPIPFGFVFGHRQLIAALENVATVHPVQIPAAYLDLAQSAMRRSSRAIDQYRQRFAAASAAASELLGTLGMQVAGASAVPFLWARIPERRNSVAFARMLLKRYRILVAPGTGFGEAGQGYVRLSLTAPKERFAGAAERVKNRHLLRPRRSRA